MGATGSREAGSNAATPEIIQFPRTFELHYRRSLHFELQLHNPATWTQYVASLPSSWHGDMILHNGPSRDCRPLASAIPKGVSFRRHLINLYLGSGWDRTQEEMQTRRPCGKRWKRRLARFPRIQMRPKRVRLRFCLGPMGRC